MVFRLPTQLEALVPPPFDQRTQPPPWRGSIFVNGMRNSDRGSNLEILVTAVETDGEKAQQWPSAFYVTVLHDQPVLGQFRAWMKAVQPLPLCTFMPNRLRDPDQHTVNQTNFRSLSSILHDNQIVAIASWAPNTFHGAGMIIYPASNTSAFLVGALFFESSFPSFINYASSPVSPISPLGMHPSRHPQYQQQRIVAVPPYEGSSPHRHAPSLSPHRSDHNSPIEQPIASHRQDPYTHRYIMPRQAHPGYPEMAQSSQQMSWGGNIKAEDENGYATYPSSHHQNPPYP